MKYVILDQIKDGDLFTLECDDKDEALKAAERGWNNLSDHDKGRREFYMVLESVDPDTDAENHLDGDVVKSWI